MANLPRMVLYGDNASTTRFFNLLVIVFFLAKHHFELYLILYMYLFAWNTNLITLECYDIVGVKLEPLEGTP